MAIAIVRLLQVKICFATDVGVTAESTPTSLAAANAAIEVALVNGGTMTTAVGSSSAKDVLVTILSSPTFRAVAIAAIEGVHVGGGAMITAHIENRRATNVLVASSWQRLIISCWGPASVAFTIAPILIICIPCEAVAMAGRVKAICVLGTAGSSITDIAVIANTAVIHVVVVGSPMTTAVTITGTDSTSRVIATGKVNGLVLLCLVIVLLCLDLQQ